MKLNIIHDLGPLAEVEIKAYLRNVSEYFGLDPDLNAFDVLWIPDETNGLKKRVIYARKGTTDILRDKYKINVTDLTQIDVPGTATFRATGTNKDGRQEIAIGSHSLEGLKGQKLADAVMTAQTRALRRLTLQFAGLGILDEAEVSAHIVDIGAQTASLAQLSGTPTVLPPPQTAPNAAPGKIAEPETPPKTRVEASQMHENTPFKEKAQYAQPTLDQLLGQQAKIDEAWGQVDAKKAEVASTELEAPKPPKARKPRRRGTVNINSPGQPVQTEMPPGQIDSNGVVSAAPATLKEGRVPTAPDQNITLPSTPPILGKPIEVTEQTARVYTINSEYDKTTVNYSTPPSAQSELSVEKQTEYRNRLKVYANEILPAGGMMPSEKIGGITMKLRRFAAVYTGATEANKMNEDQWSVLFEFLDDNKGNPTYLVQFIDKTIGA